MNSKIKELITDLCFKCGKIPKTAYYCENDGDVKIVKTLKDVAKYFGVTYSTICTYVTKDRYVLVKNRSFKKINLVEMIKEYMEA